MSATAVDISLHDLLGQRLVGDLFNVTRRTLTVLSCLETSWQVLQQRVLATALDRYETPVVLRPLNTAQQAQAMIAARMAPAFAAAACSPPYPTWPFTPAALQAVSGVTPRELLRRCAEHRQRCLAQGAASELHDFITGSATETTRPIADQHQAHDASFQRYRSEVDVAKILDEKHEDQALADLIRTACHCLLQESPLPREVYGVVDTEFTGGTATKPLHARIRLIFPDQEEREEHDSVRAIQHTHARAFQNRLKLAMTQSGIDKPLSFRRLTLVRTTPLPGGAVTAGLIAKFEAAGGNRGRQISGRRSFPNLSIKSPRQTDEPCFEIMAAEHAGSRFAEIRRPRDAGRAIATDELGRRVPVAGALDRHCGGTSLGGASRFTGCPLR